MALTALLGGILLAAAPVARAGGDFVDLAAGGRVWFVGPPGVRSLDVRLGRTLSRPRLVGAPYPLSVAFAGGAAWVGSVENGFVWGTLSRIDGQTGRVRVVWRERRSSVQQVAAGAGSVWALIGSPGGIRIVRFTLAGGVARVWRIADAGRIAADRAGCWVSTSRWLLRIDPSGRVHRVVRTPPGDLATGDGAVWLARSASVLRVDERTGRTRVLPTGRLRLGGFPDDLAVGANALWALRYESRSRSRLVRLDTHTGRRKGGTTVRGIAQALVVRSHAIWIATVLTPTVRPATRYAVVRLDPSTLRRTLRVVVS